jgi:hypothetical protein
MPYLWFKSVLLNLHVFIICSYSCFWFLILFHYDLIRQNKWFHCFIFVKTFYGLKWDLFWRKLHGLLRRMCVLHLLYGIFLYMSIKSISSMILFNSEIFLLIFCLDCLWDESEVLHFPTITEFGPIWTFMSNSVLLWNWVHQHSIHIYLESIYFLFVLKFLARIWSLDKRRREKRKRETFPVPHVGNGSKDYKRWHHLLVLYWENTYGR